MMITCPASGLLHDLRASKRKSKRATAGQEGGLRGGTWGEVTPQKHVPGLFRSIMSNRCLVRVDEESGRDVTIPVYRAAAVHGDGSTCFQRGNGCCNASTYASKIGTHDFRKIARNAQPIQECIENRDFSLQLTRSASFSRPTTS